MEQNYWNRITQQRMDRRRLLKSGAALSVGGATLALVGCSSNSNGGGGSSASPTSGLASPPAAGPTAVGTPKSGGRLVRARASGPDSFDPYAVWLEGHIYSSLHVYDHPISTRLAKEYSPFKLEAADKMELVDPTTVRLTLKPDLVYDNQAPVNGRAVKASDIVNAQNFVKNNPAATNSFQVVYMDSIEAPDDQTVIWHLTQPNAYLFSGTQMGEQSAQMMVPPEILEMDLASTKPVGSGPYRLKEFTTSADYVWEKNPTSRFVKDGLPYTQEREYITIADPSAVEASFSSGQLHAVEQTTPDQRDRLKKSLGDKMYVITYLALNPFTFNIMGKKSLNPLKADDRVRQAAYKALNRQQFLDLLYKGEGVIPPGILQPPQADYQIDWNDKTPNGMTVTEIWSQDIQQAKQLISAAGVGDQEWEINPFVSSTGLNEQSAQILQTQLGQAGLKLKIVPLPGAQGLPKAHDGKMFMFTGGHPAYDSPQTPMRQQATDSHNEFGWTGLEDPDVDALVEKSEVATDRDQNIALVKQLQLLCLSKWGGYFQLLTHNTDLLLRSEVQDWEYDAAETVTYLAKTWLNA